MFHGWGDLFNGEFEVCAAQPRGRGMRYKEPLLPSLNAIVSDYLPAILAHTDLPFAFYGHSLGGLLAFAMCRKLEELGNPLPRYLFLGACPPPILGLTRPAIHHLQDDHFVSAIQERYAGIPASVLNEPDLMEIFLPGLKADYAAHETYDRTGLVKVSRPITLFAGLDDSEYPPKSLAQWALHTTAHFTQQVVPGDHFFLATSSDQVTAEIKAQMIAALGTDQDF